MGATCEPDRFSGALFFLSLGVVLGASGLGNYTEAFRTNREMKNGPIDERACQGASRPLVVRCAWLRSCGGAE